jgi:hypothetical protein
MIISFKPIAQMEDRIVDLQALAHLGLAAIETTEPEELRRHHSTLCTLFYLILDKTGEMERSCRQAYMARCMEE